MFPFWTPRTGEENGKVTGERDDEFDEYYTANTASTAESVTIDDVSLPSQSNAPQKPITAIEEEKGTKLQQIGWKNAFEQCCKQRSSLNITLEQVLDLGVEIDWSLNPADGNPEVSSDLSVSDVLLWNDPKLQEKVVAAYEAANNIPTMPQKKKSLVSYAYQAAYGTVSFVWTAILSPGPVTNAIDDDDEFQVHLPEDYSYLEEQQYLEMFQKTALGQQQGDPIDRKDPILSVDLILHILQILADAVKRSPPCILRHQSNGWKDWIANVSMDHLSEEDAPIGKLIKQLPEYQTDFLLLCLNASKVLTVVRRHGTPREQQQSQEQLQEEPDLIVLGTDPDGRSVETRVALYVLQAKQASLRSKTDKCIAKAEEHKERALRAKRSGNKKVALHEMQLRKLCQNQNDTLCDQLLKLEQVRYSMESAANQRSVVKTLETGGQALKAMRLQSTGPDNGNEVDLVLDDLQEEMEHLNIVNDAFSSSLPVVDEDELLEELSRLIASSPRQGQESETSGDENEVFFDPGEVPVGLKDLVATEGEEEKETDKPPTLASPQAY